MGYAALWGQKQQAEYQAQMAQRNAEIANHQSAFLKDPAAYVQAVQPLDPSLPTRERLQRSLAAQQEIGKGMDFTPQLLSKAQQLKIKNTYEGMTDNTQRLHLVRGLQKEAGDLFPQLAREAKLPEAVISLSPILSEMPDKAGGTLIMAAGLAWKDLPDGEKQTVKDDALSEADSTQLGALFQGLRQAMPYNEKILQQSKTFRETLGRAKLAAKYRPDMTVTRARIMKENYDSRRYLDSLVSRGDDIYGPGMKALSFGASLVGSLPDPINIIPFARGIKAGGVGRGMLKGAIEGAVGNAAVDALVLPDLINKGEDLGMADALLDIAFGAVLGGALGGLGAYVGKRWGKGTRNAALADGLSRNEEADLLRASLSAQDRNVVATSMEKALSDHHADRPVDVSDVLRGTTTITKAQYQHFVVQLEQADEFTNVRFGKLRPDLRDALNSIRADEGVVLLDGDDLIIPANVVKKLHEKRVLEGKMSTDDVAQLLLDVFHRDADFASSTKYPHIQAVAALKKKLSTIGFIGRNDATSETIIKSVYREKTPRLEKRLGGQNSSSGGRGVPHSVDDTMVSPFAASRLSAVQSMESVAKIIDAPRSEVNFSAAALSVEAPDAFTPAPALREETVALHEEMGLDAQTGLLPEEAVVNELDAVGRVAPEDRDALLAAQEQDARVSEYDDMGQSIIPCILEVADGK